MEKKTRKQYRAEFKANVVKEMRREEKTVGQLAGEYGVHTTTLYRWRDQALAGLPGLFNDRTGTGRKRGRVAKRTRSLVC